MTDALKARSAQLVAAFEQRLDNDKSKLISSLAAVRDGSSTNGFEVVRYIAHRLVGSAHLFGCDDLDLPARTVEKMVDCGADASLVIQAVNELVERIDRSLLVGLQQPEWLNARAE
ncbi:Hpt domain-containing protein [uncultured Roseibium sp.]|uniref:Hpt domain-containing protein n=1 Tax=uncultured Roseibium sp. TaxID=1936171 RepID=UPI0026387A97|nr:Hpt domain-containing protein [uncultured Roseibium sp.]